MTQLNKPKDTDLDVFIQSIELLVEALQLRFQIDLSYSSTLSQGVTGYGNFSNFDELAGALHYKGFRTKRGKYFNGLNIKKLKSNLYKKNSGDFMKSLLDERIEWNKVSLIYALG
jgi:hypothetical protein